MTLFVRILAVSSFKSHLYIYIETTGSKFQLTILPHCLLLILLL